MALLKELMDNALDACEIAGVSPKVEIEATDDWFSVRDNGPGIPLDTITASLDYLKRVSDKLFYMSPTRGQLGNALKVVYAAPFVVDGKHALVEIWTNGFRYTIDVSLNHIRQEPEVEYTAEADDFVKSGTLVRVHWPGAATLIANEDGDSYEAQELVAGYAAFNPHAEIRLGDFVFEPTDTAWAEKKWRPNNPTSAHWYAPADARDLVAGYLAMEQSNGDRGRTLRQFVGEFRGLAGTKKQQRVLDGFSGKRLGDLVVDDDVDLVAVEDLLAAMQEHSKAPKPKALGVIGEEHMRNWLLRYAGVTPDSCEYAKRYSAKDRQGLPFVVEVAFGRRADDEGRRIAFGLNWSVGLEVPLWLGNELGPCRVDRSDPVVVVVHLVCPRFRFTDHGKTDVALDPGMRRSFELALAAVTKKWTKEKRLEEREEDRQYARRERAPRPTKTTVRDAAFEVMDEAYQKASAASKWPAQARQIMYAARPYILRETGTESLGDTYFIQKLLKDYIDLYKPEWADNVVYDARGHFKEPHGGTEVALGTIGVREYVATIGRPHEITERPPTVGSIHFPMYDPHFLVPHGPNWTYGGVLFMEKEGFGPLLASAAIANRFDVAIASAKGMPTAAASDLGRDLGSRGIPMYVVHDFDKAGFSIVATLRKGARGSKGGSDLVVDLGLRIEDVEGLETETVVYKEEDPRRNLRENGATDEEVAMLVGKQVWKGDKLVWRGRRVELNAMMADEFVTWLERKLEEHGKGKVVPDDDVLARAYRFRMGVRRMQRQLRSINSKYAPQIDEMNKQIDEDLGGIEDEEVASEPYDLRQQVIEYLKQHRTATWDTAVEMIAIRATAER